jgi:hypothetical protein
MAAGHNTAMMAARSGQAASCVIPTAGQQPAITARKPPVDQGTPARGLFVLSDVSEVVMTAIAVSPPTFDHVSEAARTSPGRSDPDPRPGSDRRVPCALPSLTFPTGGHPCNRYRTVCWFYECGHGHVLRIRRWTRDS